MTGAGAVGVGLAAGMKLLRMAAEWLRIPIAWKAKGIGSPSAPEAGRYGARQERKAVASYQGKGIMNTRKIMSDIRHFLRDETHGGKTIRFVHVAM